MTRLSSIGLARLLFQASCKHETGQVRFFLEEKPASFELQRGYVSRVSKDLSILPAEWVIRVFLMEAKQVSFVFERGDDVLDSIFPFHPAPWIRKHVQDSLLLEHNMLFSKWKETDIVLLSLPAAVICRNEQEIDLVEYLVSPRRVSEARFQTEWMNGNSLVSFLIEMDAFSNAPDYSTSEVHAVSKILDDYALLGVSRLATKKEVKTAYRQLARSFHPDAHPHADAEKVRSLSETLARIRRAYLRLMDSFSQHR